MTGGAGDSAVSRTAAGLADQLGYPLMLATVVPWAPTQPADVDRQPELLGRAHAVLERATAQLERPAELRVQFGAPVDRLFALATSERARLMVVAAGASAGPDDLPPGSAYRLFVGTAPCPVVIIPPGLEAVPPSTGPIVVGVDGSEASLGAARTGSALARRLGGRLKLVHVAPTVPLTGADGTGPNYGRELLDGHDVAVRTLLHAAERLPHAAPVLLVQHGSPAERLADVAARESAQLLVIGSGRGGLRSSKQSCSALSELATTARQPVVVVPSPGPLRRLRKAGPRPPALGRHAHQAAGAPEQPPLAQPAGFAAFTVPAPER